MRTVTSARATEEWPLGGELTRDIRMEATAQVVGEASFVLAALGALLHRYTHLPRIVVYSGAGPLQLDASGDPSFFELVARVDREMAVETLDTPRSRDGASRSDVSTVALAAGEPQQPHELEIGIEIEIDTRVSELVIAASFDCELLQRSVVQQLLRHLVTLLAGALHDPTCQVSRLSVLTRAERAQLLDEWNETARQYPVCRADELIMIQSRERAAEVAVEFEGERLTYGELEARANALAHHLQRLGVGPGVLVAIWVERSLEMLVGVLGIMRAGGTYVPIDPEFPRDRQQFMLEDAEIAVVVTQERLVPHLPLGPVSIVCLDRDAARIAAEKTSPPPCTATADNLAYVIYTSGSTGTPKGVQISHRALVNFLTTMGERPGMTPQDVLVAVTTLSFDIAGLELYLPLVTGGRVVIAPHAVAADPRRLARLLETCGATVLQATPTTWRMLVDSGWSGTPGFKSLCGGEALPMVLAEQLLERGLELWNMYGPTETTIWSAICRVSRGEPLTIGGPIANTSLYILDDALQPVPVGVPGELHIGGDGLASGYLKRPELTAERFVPHPFDPTPHARVYKTGDLARYLEDGRIEYLGRGDQQVKVRGFRIELGEIETALARQPGVTSAVAVTREDIPGDVRLVGYVVMSPAATATSADLRRALSESLPSYMIPSAVVRLGELPLTPNGKVDRRALPEPQLERSGGSEPVPPRSELEERLVRIWEAELGVSPIGITDDFFALGVTSIDAARLFAHLEHELAADLPLGALFRAPTIESLARLLEEGAAEDRWTSLVPIQPNGARPPIFCVHGGAGTILHLQPLARRLGLDQPFYGLQARGLYGGVAPLRSVEEMATHYLDELRTVQPRGPYYLAGYCFGSIVAFDMAQRLVQDGEAVGLLAAFNGPSPTWLHTYGGIGGQPSRRSRRPLPLPTRPLAHRVAGVLASPDKQWRWARHLTWRVQSRLIDRIRVGVKLRFDRPIPEDLREEFFLAICAQAELAYEPVRYPGPMVVFYGDGLYDDPELGWNGLAESIQTVAVPGENQNNRIMMAEPWVGFISERMQELLADT